MSVVDGLKAMGRVLLALFAALLLTAGAAIVGLLILAAILSIANR